MQMMQPYAERFSGILAEFGYPPCLGKIMVNNPSWCQSVSEFKQTVGSWYKNPTPDHMMNLAIFMDAKSVSGDEALLKEVRTHLSG